jgi:hypothetical protein
MKLTIKPEKVIVKPAQYSVYFYESREYGDYVGGNSGYETMNDFRPDIAAWLEENAIGWKANFDRGGWGDGPAVVKIDFVEESHAKMFHEKFNAIPCPNVSSRLHCPHLNNALRSANSSDERQSKCETCGYEIKIYKE